MHEPVNCHCAYAVPHSATVLVRFTTPCCSGNRSDTTVVLITSSNITEATRRCLMIVALYVLIQRQCFKGKQGDIWVSALNLKEFQRLLALVYSRVYNGGSINRGVVVRVCQYVFPVGGDSVFSFSLVFCNLLKPTGHVMHKQFNIQQLYVLPTLYLCVLYLSENKQRLVPLTA